MWYFYSFPCIYYVILSMKMCISVLPPFNGWRFFSPIYLQMATICVHHIYVVVSKLLFHFGMHNRNLACLARAKLLNFRPHVCITTSRQCTPRYSMGMWQSNNPIIFSLICYLLNLVQCHGVIFTCVSRTFSHLPL